jgi:hypothetical protein
MADQQPLIDCDVIWCNMRQALMDVRRDKSVLLMLEGKGSRQAPSSMAPPSAAPPPPTRKVERKYEQII